ncbi:stage V sporulation protein S [Streptomyces xanthochromogenes]|uniref:stage V sporulation protein S n=1 Tax=Streptomyces xanthochromogenes TaxID=67384 RepID=UPI001E5B7154|nr:stage V sporulation protein S [Streptomyces xanthochromogenes]
MSRKNPGTPEEIQMKNNDDESKDITVMVKSSTAAPSLGSMVARSIYEGKRITLRAVGASAVNQTAKAIAIAQGFAAPRGHDLWAKPHFFDVDIQGKTVTGVAFRVIDNAR